MAGEAKFSDLGVRITSAVVLMVIATADFIAGGLWVSALVALGVVLMLWEYRRMLVPGMELRDPALWIYCALGFLVVAAVTAFSFTTGFLVALAAAAGAAALDRERAVWLAPGLIYIALGLSILIVLRNNPVAGLYKVIWIILVVIAADVGGYFAGRLIGGPKLWPRVSPKKTWAGSLGGIALACCVGAVFAIGGWIGQGGLIWLSAVIAMASQAGDLLESWIKRRNGIKDSSQLIPGHGGLLDRFDGLLGALWAYGLLLLTGVIAL